MRPASRAALAALLLLCALPARAGDDARSYYYEDIFEPFFAPDPARPGYYRSRRPGSVESSFAAVKKPGTFRTFILGGSIASLLSDEPAQSVETFFARALPGLVVETLNCGMGGYDSYREALVEQEILEYSPDLVVFLTGHNEDLASAPIPIWILKAQERLSRWAAFRKLAATLNREGGAEAAHTDERADRRDEALARNLRANIRQARARGAEAAVVIPPRNYREPLESGLSFHDPEIAPGWVLFLRGDWAGARRAWTELLGASDARASTARAGFLWGLIGRCEEKLGRLDEARAAYDQASRLDRAAICGARCQDILRAAAREEGAFVVEADEMFRRMTAPRAPGLEIFNDRMHWKPAFNCQMSAALLEAVRARPKFAGLPWDARALEADRRSCPAPDKGATGEKDDLRILGYALRALSEPGLRKLSPSAVFYLQAVAANRPAWARDPASLPARAIDPRTVYGAPALPAPVLLARLRWHLGEAFLLQGARREAAGEFAAALALDPSLARARLGLALARGLSGDREGALRELKAASEPRDGRRDDDLAASAAAIGKSLGLEEARLAESSPSYWLSRAQKAVEGGRREEALAALAKARALRLEPHELRLAAQLYRRTGAHAEAFALSGPLTEAFPKDPDQRLDRAEAALELGRREDAAAAAKAAGALELDERQLRRLDALRRRLDGQSLR